MVKRRKVINYLVVFLLLTFEFVPLVFVMIGSVMPETEIRSSPGSKLWFNRGLVLDYYRYVLFLPFGKQFLSSDPYVMPSIQGSQTRAVHVMNVEFFFPVVLNSTIVASAVAIVNLLLASFAAFAFARYSFKGRTTSYIFVLMSRLLPPAMLVIPYYIIMQNLGFVNQLPSVIVIHSVLTLPFSIWYLVIYYRTIPVEMEEASLVDGASLLQTLRHITFPVAASGLVAISLFSFLLSYNEMLFAHFLLGRIQMYTIPVFLAYLFSSPDVYYGVIYTMLALIMVPAITLILLIYRFINFSELAGALKM